MPNPATLLICCLRFYGLFFSQMMSTDTAKVDLFCGYMHFIWSGMEQVAVAIALLIRALGPPALAGLGVVIIMIPFQGRPGHPPPAAAAKGHGQVH